MRNSFTLSDNVLFTSESVTEGHPDKICDQISDAILDAHLVAGPETRVACETAVKSNDIFLLGEITSEADVDSASVVEGVLEEIQYPPSAGFRPGSFTLHEHISKQSIEIRESVSRKKNFGAGDQGMMFGFACQETDSLMPLPIHLAHLLTRTLSQQRKSGKIPWLLPDGKAQVTVEYNQGQAERIHTVVVSAQHAEGISHQEIEEAILGQVVEPVLRSIDVPSLGFRHHINPSGAFSAGGPEADAGLTGRKIIVDTYGGMGRHGGGAFSGKDPTKVDRSACYMARLVAKCIVAAGLATRCEVQLAYAIGHDQPVSLLIEDFGTGCQDLELALVRQRVEEYFDLSPKGIIQALALFRPIYQPTATYGHFGRTDLIPQLPWENLAVGPAAEFINSWH